MVHGLDLGFRTGSVSASLSVCPGGPLSWRTQCPCFKVSVQRILEAFAQGLLVENVHLTNFPFRYTATQDLRLRGSVRSKLRRWTSHQNRQTGWLSRVAEPSIFSFLMMPPTCSKYT
jgi:hypothetical protein